MSNSNKGKTDYMNEFNSDFEEDTQSGASSEQREDFASMLAESFKSEGSRKLRVGDKIRGKILSLASEDVFVTTPTRHEGLLSRKDLLDANGECPYKVGDLIDVYVTLVKGDTIRLSKNPTDRNLAEDLKTAYENDQAIQGRIVEAVKGGVRVNIKGKLAFCPISQIDSKHIESVEEYVGKLFDFKITEMSEGGRNVVVSRRKLLDAERESGTAHFLSETKDGDAVTGRITRIEAFGAFVELSPGVDGLVHVSEISWARVNNPSEILAVGQTVTAKLLKREIVNGKAKISLSIKQLAPREAADSEAKTKKDDLVGKIAVGQVFTGKVTRKEVFGLFVEIEPGLNGLLHKSQLQNANEIHLDKTRVGDSVTVQVGEIKMPERQISLRLPGDQGEEDWRSYQKTSAPQSMGTLAERMSAALQKKK